MQTSITDKLDQLKACVHCGICLPACPTYLTTGNEGHSPRGRLYLIRDFVESSLSSQPHDLLQNGLEQGLRVRSSGVDSSVNEHAEDEHNTVIGHFEASNTIDYLDACLSCRACESVCPSGVEYGSILDYARHEAKLSNYDKGVFALIRRLSFKYLLNNRTLLNLNRLILRIINFTQIPKLLQTFIPQLKLSPRLDQPYRRIKTDHTYSSLQAQHSNPPTVSLPLGCVMDTLYNHVHWDTIKVLNSLGYNVYIPETNCCGALASHSGESKIGAAQTRNIIKTLSQHNYPVVFNSAGCSAHLKGLINCKSTNLPEINNINTTGYALATDSAETCRKAPFCYSERSEESPAPAAIYDFIEIIQNDFKQLATKLKNDKPIKVTYHPACHLNHAQGIKTEYQELLQLIPNLTLIPLQEADVCCGSAGFYNLIKPQMADKIGARKAENINKTQAQILVTANPGCISQIQAQTGNIVVMHPISLIAKYLDD